MRERVKFTGIWNRAISTEQVGSRCPMAHTPAKTKEEMMYIGGQQISISDVPKGYPHTNSQVGSGAGHSGNDDFLSRRDY